MSQPKMTEIFQRKKNRDPRTNNPRNKLWTCWKRTGPLPLRTLAGLDI